MAAFAAACSTLHVGNDDDRQAQFGGYHRFRWLARERTTDANPLIEQRARDTIQASLTAKGRVRWAMVLGGRPGWWGYPYWGCTIDVTR